MLPPQLEQAQTEAATLREQLSAKERVLQLANDALAASASAVSTASTAVSTSAAEARHPNRTTGPSGPATPTHGAGAPPHGLPALSAPASSAATPFGRTAYRSAAEMREFKEEAARGLADVQVGFRLLLIDMLLMASDSSR